MKEYKKSYTLFILLLLIYCIGLTLCMFLPFDIHTLILIILNTTTLYLTLLTYIIYKTEYIYWYSGISYDDVKNIESIQRKEYARKHFVLFFKFQIYTIIYSMIAYLLVVPYILTIIIYTIALIIILISTMSIKLQE